MKTELLFKEEVYRIVGCAFEVYNELGPGFLEAVYQEALETELTDQGVPFEAQKLLDLFYKKRPMKKKFKADLLCCSDLVVELKAIERLTRVDYRQTVNYLKATKKRIGVLINFGAPQKLEWKRLIF